MGFNPGGGGAISAATDVAFNSVQDDQVLTYDAGSSKWQNQQTSVPQSSVLATSGTTRPSADPTITVIFKGNDPGANALDGDIWLGAP